jgi:uncharacterized membrane protein
VAERRVPVWVPVASLGLCLAGIAVASYLTYEHYTGSVTLSCPSTGAIDCLKVTTSTYSTIVGIPVALLGLLYFVAAAPLCLPVAWRSTRSSVHRVRIGGSLLGVGFVVYLVWAELFRINAICLWCTGVHVITVLLFFVICFGTALLGPPDDETA